MHQENGVERSTTLENGTNKRESQDISGSSGFKAMIAPPVAPAKPEHSVFSSGLPGVSGSVLGPVFGSGKRHSSPELSLPLKRNGSPQWGSGLSRKKLANDVSGKPCLSTGNPPQTDICGDQENLGERISILEKAEAEMERQLTEQRGSIRKAQNAVQALRQQIQSLEEATPLSAISSDDSPLASPCASPTKSTSAHLATTPPPGTLPARLQPSPDAAHRDPFSSNPPTTSAAPAAPSTLQPCAPALALATSPSVAAVLASSRFTAARMAHNALADLPPRLAALGHSSQVYSHGGHAVMVQRSLYDCPENAAAVQDAVAQHETHKVRLAGLLQRRRREQACRQAALVDKYVDKYSSHVQQASFAEVDVPPPQHLRYGLQLWRPQDDLALVDEHSSNFDCAMPQQMTVEEADRELFEDSSRLVPDPVAAMQEARITRPWSTAEKEAFKKEFLEHFKDFPALAAAMRTRSVLEVTKHFYEVRKKGEFKNHDRKFTLKKRRDGIKERNEKNSMFGPLSTAAPRSSATPLLSSGTPLSAPTPGPTSGARKAAPQSLDPRFGGPLLTTPAVSSPQLQTSRPRGPAVSDDEYFATVHGKGLAKGAAAPKGALQPPRARQHRNKDRDARASLDDRSLPLGNALADGVPDMAKVMRVAKLDSSVEVAPLHLDSMLPGHTPPLPIASLNTGDRSLTFAASQDGITSPRFSHKAFSEGGAGLAGPPGGPSSLLLSAQPLQDGQHLGILEQAQLDRQVQSVPSLQQGPAVASAASPAAAKQGLHSTAALVKSQAQETPYALATAKPLVLPMVGHAGSSPNRPPPAPLAACDLSPEPPTGATPAADPAGLDAATQSPAAGQTSITPPVKGVAHSLLHRHSNRSASGLFGTSLVVPAPLASSAMAPVQEQPTPRTTNTAAVAKDLGTMRASTSVRGVSPRAPGRKRDIASVSHALLGANVAVWETQAVDSSSTPVRGGRSPRTLGAGQPAAPFGPQPSGTASVQMPSAVSLDTAPGLLSASSREMDAGVGNAAPEILPGEPALGLQGGHPVHNGDESGPTAPVADLLPGTIDGTPREITDPSELVDGTMDRAQHVPTEERSPARSACEPAKSERIPFSAVVSAAEEVPKSAGANIEPSPPVTTVGAEKEAGAVPMEVDAAVLTGAGARAALPDTAACSPPPVHALPNSPAATSPPQPRLSAALAHPVPSPPPRPATSTGPPGAAAVQSLLPSRPAVADVHDSALPLPPSPGDLSDGVMDWEMTPSTPVQDAIPPPDDDARASAASERPLATSSPGTATTELPRVTAVSADLPVTGSSVAALEAATAQRKPSAACSVGRAWGPENGDGATQANKGSHSIEGASLGEVLDTDGGE